MVIRSTKESTKFHPKYESIDKISSEVRNTEYQWLRKTVIYHREFFFKYWYTLMYVIRIESEAIKAIV